MSENESAPTLRISGPADLLQAVPYLLGFHPADSLVLVGLAAGQLVVTVRVDLDDLAEPAVLAEAIEAMCRGGSEQLIGAVYSDSGDAAAGAPWAGVVRLLGEYGERHGCTISDVLRVADGRWWSYLCSDRDCCPPAGRALPESPSPFVAAATYAGMVALPDRGQLAAVLEPLPAEHRAALDPLIGEREDAQVQAVLAGRAQREERSVKRAIFAVARRAGAPAAVLSDSEVARFGAALASITVRDAVWMAVDDGRLDGRELWRELARRLPSPYDAPPLFLYGWACWRAGNGALAGIAAERALTGDPGYSAADLLLAALSRGVDPRRLPRLRLPRSA